MDEGPTTAPFTDSRRLLGANPYFDGVGAALEATVAPFSADLVAAWRARVARARAALGWTDGAIFAHPHAGGATLAFAAPLDQLFAATDANEWALEAALLSFSLRGEMARLRTTGSRDIERLLTGAEAGARSEVPAGRMREDADSTEILSNKHLPFDSDTLAFIRHLRHVATDAEHLVWAFLRDRRLDGHKFRRQHPLGPYVLDFYCHELKLAVELDGGQHGEAEQQAHDERRDAFVANHGIRTLRFWNHDVLARTVGVLAEIWRVANASIPEHAANGHGIPSSALRAPSPEGGREQAPGADAPPSPGGREDAAWLHAPGFAAAWDEEAALHTLRELARSEANPALPALAQAAHEHHVALLIADEDVALGEGNGARVFPLDPLPDPERIRWASLHNIPVALVTGTNGKTTTVRLLAAMARAHGWSTGHSCTDGLYVDGRPIAAGDYSGPAGAREVLRQPGLQCAILETARGGVLRRGLAMQHAQAAVVTNLSADHYGSYGIYGLDDLARVKLTVARVLDAGGLLVLNADDPTLRAHAGDVDCTIGWFALDHDHPLLVAQRAAGGATCGVRDGRAVLAIGGTVQDLGAVADMPLTVRGAARYNIANLLAAALAATALGIPAATIAATLARFGAVNADNPGRLQHWTLAGVEVWMDYAHNPDGLRNLLEVTGVADRSGRFGLLLGQAGDRSDADLGELARVAAHGRPDRVVLKDMPGFLRGRAPGEVASILQRTLRDAGVEDRCLVFAEDEEPGVRELLDWAQPQDVLVLPVHGKAARAKVSSLLDRLAAMHWIPGQPLP